jgi:hypothetical protein
MVVCPVCIAEKQVKQSIMVTDNNVKIPFPDAHIVLQHAKKNLQMI